VLYTTCYELGDIFIDEKDRSDFLEAVGEMSERFDIDIFAYVLMDNHYHLLVRNPASQFEKSYALVRDHLHATFQPAPFSKRAFISGSL